MASRDHEDRGRQCRWGSGSSGTSSTKHLAQAQKLPQSGKADASAMGNKGGTPAGAQGKGS